MKLNVFLKEYVRHPRDIGAFAPSSRYLALRMIEDIDFKRARVIIEYGPGTGVFTERLLNFKNPETLLLAIENNASFSRILQNRFNGSPNFRIITGSAANVPDYLNRFGFEKADYIVSGLPFSSLPRGLSETILAKTSSVLETHGAFITFQYSLMMKWFIGRFFADIRIKKEFINLPPAYILTCRNTR
jgi:phospholipid N-methyltransferase